MVQWFLVYVTLESETADELVLLIVVVVSIAHQMQGHVVDQLAEENTLGVIVEQTARLVQLCLVEEREATVGQTVHERFPVFLLPIGVSLLRL